MLPLDNKVLIIKGPLVQTICLISLLVDKSFAYAL